VAILFFIGAESMFFAALVSALFILRASLPVWPPPLQPRLPAGVTAVNTLILLASGAAIGAGVRAARHADGARLVRWFGAGALLGVLFIAVRATSGSASSGSASR
jgi:heme/copper-type cytochrome/quinol oxidase subunit 3